MYDYVIRNGVVFDGSGAPGRTQDIAIKDGLIAAVEDRIDAPAAEVIEAAGAIVLLVPSVSVFAAALLMLIDAGALVAQLAVLHGDVIHCLVIGAVLAALIHLQRDSLAGRLVGRIDVP